MASTTSPSTTTSRPYAGKAHEYVPEFSNKASEYKEYKKRVLLYKKKMSLAGRAKETAFNIIAALTGRAWDAREDLQMADLEAETGVATLLKGLDSVFKYDAITELRNDFERVHFERALRKLESHSVNLPDKVIGWFFLRRAGLKQDQRQMVMSTLSVEKLNMETARKALNFAIEQDSAPEVATAYNAKNARNKESIYYEDDEMQPPDYYNDLGYDNALDEGYYMDDDAAYWDEDDDEADAAYTAEDAAAECDEVFAAYVEARQRMNQMRLSRGYYPVVAMVPGGQNTSKGQQKGKRPIKGSKSKGKTQMKQAPRTPNPRARGKTALGSVTCLRCGQAGHYAKNCPQSSTKRKADGPADSDAMVHMVANDDNDVQQINMHEDDGEESEPDDTGIWDCGAASVLLTKMQLKKYLKMLLMAGYDIYNIKVTIDYSEKKIKWGEGEWKVAPLGPKGEYVLHLAEHIVHLRDAPVKETLVPEDFYDHVQLETEYNIMDLIQEMEEINMIDENAPMETSPARARTTPRDTASPHSLTDLNLDKIKDIEPPILVNSDGIAPVPYQLDGNAPMVDEKIKEHRMKKVPLGADEKNEQTSPTSDSQPPKKIKLDESVQNLKKLTGNKLRSMTHKLEQKVKENDKIFMACTKDVDAKRFSLEEGWDFTQAKCRKAFINKLVTEEPDSVLLSRVCRLWSVLQELNIAQSEEYRAELQRQRQENHDTILTFVAIVYEIQRRNGRDATVEHPWRAKSWRTKAFNKMIGYDCYVDQCCYKLAMPDVDGVMLAENYPPKLAAKLAEALVTQVNHWDDVNAAEELNEVYNKLRRQVGNRPFEYVQRLHKNTGHISNDTLHRMLEEIQATENVLTAAKNYVCPTCYARKRLAQAASQLRWTATGFNVKNHLFNYENLKRLLQRERES
ncbi:unnamed protein product [Cladocopium goreaui]|uniref:Eukaryotic translation initiation factor isoform 4G-2 n=1 Tax=Cladocopium goreaui TaxID=2562237 RepID=A0A9P1M5Q7_9DINO|nr:unnamed protein product [Cladocopium goreaui]